MSILGSSSSDKGKMNAPSFHEIKKQASFFLKEKIKTARLALTDVTPAQLLTEEATNGNPGGPDARALKMISKAAFEVDDYWRIVGVLHRRLANFDKRNWRPSYKAVIVLEYLLTHGPESVAEEFQVERNHIREMEIFQHIDEKGFNWGLNVRKKCEMILKLLEKGPFLKEEREKARKISRGIKGFGSFNIRTSSGQEIPQESSLKAFDRCNSQFIDQSYFLSEVNENNTTKADKEKVLFPANSKGEHLSIKNLNIRADSEENLAPTEIALVREDNESIWNFRGESKPLLEESGVKISMEDHHPFDEADHLTAMSLLSTAEMS